jgi:hypothetical protein
VVVDHGPQLVEGQDGGDQAADLTAALAVPVLLAEEGVERDLPAVEATTSRARTIGTPCDERRCDSSNSSATGVRIVSA